MYRFLTNFSCDSFTILFPGMCMVNVSKSVMKTPVWWRPLSTSMVLYAVVCVTNGNAEYVMLLVNVSTVTEDANSCPW